MSLVQLRDQLLASGCGRNDQVLIMISECISEGIDEGPAIVRTLVELGFDRKHVGILLSRHTGFSPARHSWFKDGNGKYRLHPPTDPSG